MAFTDDAVKAKLSSLNETQEGIVTVAQWIMFHRRHADRTAQLWMQRIKDSQPNKKLNLIYLANEVIQQSKMRKKMEFVNSYSPIIVEAATAAYKGSPSDIQQKIRRVIEVWRQRLIFDPPIQEAIEKSIDEVDRSRGTRGVKTLGGSLFKGSSSSVPADLQPLVDLKTSLEKAEIHAKPATSSANEEYAKLTNPANPVPTPPVHAARLATLLKSLANAEGAVAESIKARQALISGLEKLLSTNKATLEKEEVQRNDLTAKKSAIENRKRDVEDAIMRGLSAAETAAISTATPMPTSEIHEPPRPNIEELTPPPMESFTPEGSPQIPEVAQSQLPSHPEHSSFPPFSVASAPQVQPNNPPIPGADLLASLTRTRAEESANGPMGGTYPGPSPTLKKRKVGRSAAEDEFAAFAGEMEGLDKDVAGLLDG